MILNAYNNTPENRKAFLIKYRQQLWTMRQKLPRIVSNKLKKKYGLFAWKYTQNNNGGGD